jgi:hypothetical protein
MYDRVQIMNKAFNPTVDMLDEMHAPVQVLTSKTGFELTKNGEVVLPDSMRWTLTTKTKSYGIVRKIRLEQKTRFGYRVLKKFTHIERFDSNKKVVASFDITDIQDNLFYRVTLDI